MMKNGHTLQFCVTNKATFSKFVWPFFIIMHKRINAKFGPGIHFFQQDLFYLFIWKIVCELLRD